MPALYFPGKISHSACMCLQAAQRAAQWIHSEIVFSSQVIRSRGKCDHQTACPDSRWDNHPPALTTLLDMCLPVAHPPVNTANQMWGWRALTQVRKIAGHKSKMLNTMPGRYRTWEPGILICPPQTHTDLKWINFILWDLVPSLV